METRLKEWPHNCPEDIKQAAIEIVGTSANTAEERVLVARGMIRERNRILSEINRMQAEVKPAEHHEAALTLVAVKYRVYEPS